MASASSRGSLLNELHIVGRKHAKVAIWPIATPPAFVNHLNAGDEVLRVKGDLGLVGCLVVIQGPGTEPFPTQPRVMVNGLRAGILLLHHWRLLIESLLLWGLLIHSLFFHLHRTWRDAGHRLLAEICPGP